MSDIHVEFQPDEGRSFFAALEVKAPAVILAGDINNNWKLSETLQRFAKKYQYVIFVPGNHEYYLGTSEDVIPGYGRRMIHEAFDLAKEVVEENTGSKIHILYNSVVEIEGVKIAGTPLWFPDQPDNKVFEHEMSDFRQIPNYASWVYSEAKKAEKFLKNLKDVDIVVTHHLPSTQCEKEQKTTKLSRFFVNPVLDKFDWPTFPKYWIHGHTHRSIDIQCGETRVLCNPFGYMAVPVRDDKGKVVIKDGLPQYVKMLNPEFTDQLVIEV
jgi:UDP-2,3-diacylglucosamine pyrophosphatase LpxH